MTLLKARSLVLESFEENAIPPYSILSYTWGIEEVSFQDIQRPIATWKLKAGYAKIKYTCEGALRRSLDYVWIDTCCIDKSSSAELSEAINSMFRWYQNAVVCYAYLADVSDMTDVHASNSDFARSRWFSRGWTLQELLAPKSLQFFSGEGQLLGTKLNLSPQISKITGIGERFLTGDASLSQASIARRMSWASQRKTTRSEDISYCLLSIFEINMPMLYGEGAKAFRRLQEEIMKNSADQTLFARKIPVSYPLQKTFGPFANGPAAFKDSGDFVPDELDESRILYNGQQGVFR